MTLTTLIGYKADGTSFPIVPPPPAIVVAPHDFWTSKPQPDATRVGFGAYATPRTQWGKVTFDVFKSMSIWLPDAVDQSGRENLFFDIDVGVGDWEWPAPGGTIAFDNGISTGYDGLFVGTVADVDNLLVSNGFTGTAVFNGYNELEIQFIPEPSALLLGGIGAMCVLAYGRNRQHRVD